MDKEVAISQLIQQQFQTWHTDVYDEVESEEGPSPITSAADETEIEDTRY